MDAHISILWLIWLLVATLGSGPEMFKKLEGGNQIRLQILFQKFFLFSFHPDTSDFSLLPINKHEMEIRKVWLWRSATPKCSDSEDELSSVKSAEKPTLGRVNFKKIRPWAQGQ